MMMISVCDSTSVWDMLGFLLLPPPWTGGAAAAAGTAEGGAGTGAAEAAAEEEEAVSSGPDEDGGMICPLPEADGLRMMLGSGVADCTCTTLASVGEVAAAAAAAPLFLPLLATPDRTLSLRAPATGRAALTGATATTLRMAPPPLMEEDVVHRPVADDNCGWQQQVMGIWQL